ncbi:MAG: hypothetical protein IKO76_07280 [Butyrivibrio sp.]|nr:hypothetical protein [Butyrivibrio sp.]
MRTLEALVSFASREWSPSPGQVKACSDELAADLIRAGYAKPVGEEKKVPPAEEAKQPEKKEEVAKNESKSGNNRSAVPAAKGKRGSTKRK